MTVTVASATFSITGIQLSRSVDVIRLSTAPLRMSMPGKKRCVIILTDKLELLVYPFWKRVNMSVKASACILPMGLATGIMPMYKTWNFCTSSVFGVGNSAKEDNEHVTLKNKCVHKHDHREECVRCYPAAGRRVLCGSYPAESLRP